MVTWTPQEEENLRKGVHMYGESNWDDILKDPLLGLQGRTPNIRKKWSEMKKKAKQKSTSTPAPILTPTPI